MEINREVDELDHILPSANSSTWPPPPLKCLEQNDQGTESTRQFFVGILTGFGYYLFSTIFYAFSLFVFWRLAESNVYSSRWLDHDLPTNLFGRALLFFGFLSNHVPGTLVIVGSFLCHVPGILRFTRFRTHQPRYAWGVISGSFFTMLALFVLSWYLNQAYPTI